MYKKCLAYALMFNVYVRLFPQYLLIERKSKFIENLSPKCVPSSSSYIEARSKERERVNGVELLYQLHHMDDVNH